MRKALLITLLLFSAVFVMAKSQGTRGVEPQPVVSPEAEAVKKYCESVADFKRENAPLLFADASDQPKPAWRRVASERELERLTDALFQHSNTARAWVKDGNIIAVDTTSTTMADDWSLDAEYCYREDGTLAGVRSEYRNGTDDLIVISEQLFGVDGSSVFDNVKALDLRTRRPKKNSANAAELRAPAYARTKDFPWTKLMR